MPQFQVSSEMKPRHLTLLLHILLFLCYFYISVHVGIVLSIYCVLQQLQYSAYFMFILDVLKIIFCRKKFQKTTLHKRSNKVILFFSTLFYYTLLCPSFDWIQVSPIPIQPNSIILFSFLSLLNLTSNEYESMSYFLLVKVKEHSC